MFGVSKGEVDDRCGWIVRHAASREILSGESPFATRRIAQNFVARLPGLTMADGSPFDWAPPGVGERLAAGCGADGGSLTSALAALRDEVELEAIDERKPRPTGPQSPFGSHAELRAHFRALAAKHVGDDDREAWRLTVLASDKTLGIAPGGQLIYWRDGPRAWAIATSWTAVPVKQNIEDKVEAYELATWLETHVTGADGPFPFGAADVKRRAAGWRSVRGVSLEQQVVLARGEFDRSKGRAGTWAMQMAGYVEDSIAQREATARRAAAGGYDVDRPPGLVMHDEIEWDVTVDDRNRHLLTGELAPALGATVTLRGVIARHVSHTEHGVGVAFERGGLGWSDAGGARGTVAGDAWRFAAYATAEPVIYRRRAPEIDELTPEMWHAAYAEALALSIGLSETVTAALRRAVQAASIDDFERKLFAGDAREAGAELRDAPPAELDRKLMSLRGFLDEYEAWDRLNMELNNLASAALLVAVAAERRRRRIGPPGEEYWSGPARAERIHREDTIDPASLRELPARALRGAFDYAEARRDANAGWRPHVRTGAMDADGQRWRSAAAALAAACPQR